MTTLGLAALGAWIGYNYANESLAAERLAAGQKRLQNIAYAKYVENLREYSLEPSMQRPIQLVYRPTHQERIILQQHFDELSRRGLCLPDPNNGRVCQELYVCRSGDELCCYVPKDYRPCDPNTYEYVK